MSRQYLLLDANIVAAYYLPRSISSKRAADRMEEIVDSVRGGASDLFLYIPNFCIAETFSVFMKHTFGKWNSHVKKAGGRIDRRVYESLITQFQADIHNGALLNQYELSRYHVLAINLVAPIDHHFQITRGKKRHAPSGTFDHLLIAMGIQLAKIHGPDNVTVVSADQRLCDVLEKCRGGLKASVVKKLKLRIGENVTGRAYSPGLYPKCLNLTSATKQNLKDALGSWPLPKGKLPKAYRWLK